ncbi:transglutaminase N-terminal domain-containing protein [Paenarthrobacter sp. NPDC092416]|uniref:transglutaminase family protein n=1 Tax=Paenarthrobacter sp. NPDC092416 TaxID=3364386 RepID=UPI0037F8BC66
MTRLSIVHTTSYTYNASVERSYNEARITPLSSVGQTVLESTVKIWPSSAATGNYIDYWGSKVTTFDLQQRHETMKVTATATVEVDRTQRVAGAASLSWELLCSPRVVSGHSEWLTPTPLTAVGDEIQASVAKATAGMPPTEAATAVMAWMKEEMSYVPGVTGVTTNAEQAWQQRKGVCQDLAHLGIGALRSINIPARYVSGYIHPRPQASIGETVAGQSHAWLQWWDGQWRSWDPTNHKPASDFHVSVATGRDFRDVSPVRGILSGGGGTAPAVTVEMTRLA